MSKMPDRTAFKFVDIDTKSISPDIESVFPGWKAGDEQVVILSPHDDDGILGAGHIALAAQAFGGDVHVVIFSCGCLGYSSPDMKDTIVETRRQEYYDAYEMIDIPRSNVHRLEFDDLSILMHVGWRTPAGSEGTVAKLIPTLRKIRATRLVVPNHYRENVDHEAVYKAAVYEGPQMGDAIMAEFPIAEPLRSAIQYSVWSDFAPDDALTTGRDQSLRANTMVLCDKPVAESLNTAVAAWKSQEKIIKGLVESRKSRLFGDYSMETYIRFDPRPALDYAPYAEFLKSISGGKL
jgi:LmbE family N-acetylglucosaminyl deacetylase